MAENQQGTFKLEVSNVERLYLKQAVKRYMESLERSRGKEVSGSEVHTLRGRELETIAALDRRL